MGGVAIDRDGRTDVPGLYAVGEVTGGIHGSNRLQDNALPDLFVFGTRAAAAVARESYQASEVRLEGTQIDALERWASRLASGGDERQQTAAIRHALQELMWLHAGVVRDDSGLTTALAHLAGLEIEIGALRARSPTELVALAETEHGIEVGQIVCTAARHRCESRGAHARSDYPEPAQEWERAIRWRRGTDTLLSNE